MGMEPETPGIGQRLEVHSQFPFGRDHAVDTRYVLPPRRQLLAVGP